uniref:asparaginase n=1 Tax=Lygus hesperus TaxID=30085 RepID=A0A0A9Z605_LYGHE
MCTTASAISFMLQNLGKPVIFTGSVIPGNRIYTDLKRNIILALTMAAYGQLCEVAILFNDRLFRANRTTRTNRSKLQPFASPHYPPLGSMIGNSLQLHNAFLRPQPHGALNVMPHMSAIILTLYLGPSLPPNVLHSALQHTSARAVILCCYGSGNGPSRDGYMTRALAIAQSRDLVVVICTQNNFGTVTLNEYATGQQLLKAGALSALDMTT